MSLDLHAQLKQIQEELQAERKLREQAEGRAEQARQRAEQEKKQTRRTTFEELLESCHRLSESVSVQTDRAFSTKGSTTSPKGKSCPKSLQPWIEFPSVQQEAFDEVYNLLHPQDGTSPRLFSPLIFA